MQISRFSLSFILILWLLVCQISIAKSLDQESVDLAPLDPSIDLSDKTMDTSWLVFKNSSYLAANNVILTFQSSNCFECEPIPVFFNGSRNVIKISSQHEWFINLIVKDEQMHHIPTIADVEKYHFKEYGVYDLVLIGAFPTPGLRIEIHNIRPGVLSYIPIIVAISAIIGISILYKIFEWLWKKRRGNSSQSEPLLQAKAKKHHVKPRLRSLDAFRGMSLFFMVFVNYGGGGYWFFNHSNWNGITFADLVFPWFVWIMGAAMPFAFSAAEKKSQPKLVQFFGLFRRSIILFCLGLFLNNGHFLNEWRIPGVLQRFAIAYLFIGMLYIFVPKFGQNKPKPVLAEESASDIEVHFRVNSASDYNSSGAIFSGRESRSSVPNCLVDYFSDIYPFWVEYLLVAVLILVWFLLTFLLKVPGCPTGYLGPGGIHSPYPNCTGGAAGYIDRSIFGYKHIFDDPTCRAAGPGDVPSNYQCMHPYDPEGLLGNLTSIFLCFLGLQAGRIMKIYQTHRARMARLVIHGLFWGAIGTGLCGASKENGVLPLNKNLWSFSFVAVMGALAFLTLAVFFLLIDWIQVWKGAPFTYIGMNSIVVYMGHEILDGYFPFAFTLKNNSSLGYISNHWIETASDLTGACWWIVIVYILFKKKIFIRI